MVPTCPEVRGRCARGRRADRRRRPGRPAADHPRWISRPASGADLVQHDDQRGPARTSSVSDARPAPLVGQVDPGGRLVQDQQVRLAGQGPGDQHPLLLPARQLRQLGRRPGPARPTASRARATAARSSGRGGTKGGRRASRPEATTSSHLGSAEPGGRALRHVADPRPAPEGRPAGCRTARPSRAGSAPDRAARGPASTCPDPLPPSRATASPGAHRHRDPAQHREAAELDARVLGRASAWRAPAASAVTGIRWPSSGPSGWTA